MSVRVRLVRDHEIGGKGAFLFSAAQRGASKLDLSFDITKETKRFVTDLNSDKHCTVYSRNIWKYYDLLGADRLFFKVAHLCTIVVSWFGGALLCL